MGLKEVIQEIRDQDARQAQRDTAKRKREQEREALEYQRKRAIEQRTLANCKRALDIFGINNLMREVRQEFILGQSEMKQNEHIWERFGTSWHGFGDCRGYIVVGAVASTELTWRKGERQLTMKAAVDADARSNSDFFIDITYSEGDQKPDICPNVIDINQLMNTRRIHVVGLRGVEGKRFKAIGSGDTKEGSWLSQRKIKQLARQRMGQVCVELQKNGLLDLK